MRKWKGAHPGTKCHRSIANFAISITPFCFSVNPLNTYTNSSTWLLLHFPLFAQFSTDGRSIFLFCLMLRTCIHPSFGLTLSSKGSKGVRHILHPRVSGKGITCTKATTRTEGHKNREITTFWTSINTANRCEVETNQRRKGLNLYVREGTLSSVGIIWWIRFELSCNEGRLRKEVKSLEKGCWKK